MNLSEVMEKKNRGKANERAVSVKEGLEMAIVKLSNIQIPAAMVRKIGIPIAESIDLIRMCSDVIREPEKKEQNAVELFSGGQKIGETETHAAEEPAAEG